MCVVTQTTYSSYFPHIYFPFSHDFLVFLNFYLIFLLLTLNVCSRSLSYDCNPFSHSIIFTFSIFATFSQPQALSLPLDFSFVTCTTDDRC